LRLEESSQAPELMLANPSTQGFLNATAKPALALRMISPAG